MKSLLILLHVLGLSGCADVLDDPKVEAKAFNKASIRYSMTQLPDPNRYEILINWDKTSDKLFIRDRNSRGIVKEPTGTQFQDEVSGGKTYEYKLSSLNAEGNSIELATIQIPVPQDLIFDGETLILGKPHLVGNRLFIKKNSITSFHDQSVVIEVNDVISEGGTIQNYPYPHVRCMGCGSSQTGGDITLVAQHGSGAIHFILTGTPELGPEPAGLPGSLRVQIDDGNLQVTPEIHMNGWHSTNGGRWGSGSSCISVSKAEARDCLH